MKRTLLFASLLFSVSPVWAAEELPPALPGAVEMAANEQQAEASPEVYEFPELNIPAATKAASSPAAPAPSRNRVDEAAPNPSRLKAETIRTAVMKALTAKGAGDDMVIDGMRFNHQLSTFLLPENPNDLGVQDVSFDAQRNTFTGRAIAPGQQAVQFRGRYYTKREVPVLARRMMTGEVISDADVTMVSLPSKRLNSAKYQLSRDSLVGKTLKRNVAANRPLRRQDISLPQAVENDKQVTMIFRSGALQLTDLGIVLEKGAVGDVVRVKNMKSGQMVRARVESPDAVLVNYMDAPLPAETASLANGEVDALQN